ncbi:hypothetical protein [Arthrobacter sp. HLT1-20]
MSDVKLNRGIHQAQKITAAGVKQVLEDPSKVLGPGIRWVQTFLEKSKAPQTVADIIDSAADRVKLPRRVRKHSVKALKHAARNLRLQANRRHRNQQRWLIGGSLLAAAVAGTIITVRLLRRQQEAAELAAKIDGPLAPPLDHEPDNFSEQPETPARKDTGSDQAENPTISPAVPSERTESP